MIYFRQAERAIFAFGFAKSDRENLSATELAAFRKTAKEALGFAQEYVEAVVKIGKLIEVNGGDEDL